MDFPTGDSTAGMSTALNMSERLVRCGRAWEQARAGAMSTNDVLVVGRGCEEPGMRTLRSSERTLGDQCAFSRFGFGLGGEGI